MDIEVTSKSVDLIISKIKAKRRKERTTPSNGKILSKRNGSCSKINLPSDISTFLTALSLKNAHLKFWHLIAVEYYDQNKYKAFQQILKYAINVEITKD